MRHRIQRGIICLHPECKQVYLLSRHPSCNGVLEEQWHLRVCQGADLEEQVQKRRLRSELSAFQQLKPFCSNPIQCKATGQSFRLDNQGLLLFFIISFPVLPQLQQRGAVCIPLSHYQCHDVPDHVMCFSGIYFA